MTESLYCASPIQVFVYGTLKPGQENFNRYCLGQKVISQAAIARGLLYQLPMGYPAMMPGAGWVSGFRLTFEDGQLLAVLDRLETYAAERPPSENEYQRVLLEVFTPDQQPLGPCWGYQMWASKIQALGGIPIPSGRWEPER